jgi:SAM-dependent methyltransferase
MQQAQPAPDHFDSFFELDRSELEERLKRESYFHDIETHGIRTGSMIYPDCYPPNYHLWPVFKYLGELDLVDRSCLDIGTFDGMTAFVMSELGAGHVDATCQYDLDRFRIIRALCRYKNVAYHAKTDLAMIGRTFEAAQYDVVVISAMMHHLTSPLDGLLEVRRLLKREGCLVIESIFRDKPDPALLLNTELASPVYGAPTLFIPTLTALRGMLNLAGFEIVSETRLLGGAVARETNYERVTFLARARKPSEITSRSAKAAEIHRQASKMGPVDFAVLQNDTSRASELRYRGPEGARTLNIWLDEVPTPLQPTVRVVPQDPPTMFVAAREKGFLKLVSQIPDGAFSWNDVHLLGARYPGETMPDGMTWGLKQFGNLHVLDYVRKLGLARVLEIGPGFNLYFVNHLPSWCTYVALDAAGFYDANVMGLAKAARDRAGVETIDALIGQTDGIIASGSFDTCVSVSVIEHIPASDIPAACSDMFRVLRPGGWAIHSLDASSAALAQVGKRWLTAFQDAGFRMDAGTVDTLFGGEAPESNDDPLFGEPLSIRCRFAQGYRDTIWGSPDQQPLSPASTGTILIAAQKPRYGSSH